jgi:cytochrome P450
VRILTSNLKGSGIAAELPWLAAILKHVPIEKVKELFRGHDILMKYGREARAKSKSAEDDKSIFSTASKEAEKEGGHLDELDVQYESQGLLVAGADTTAVSMTYLVWAVLLHPRWQAELEKEVGTLSPDANDEELERLPILNAVIEETLRLYGAAPGALPRTVPKGGAKMMDYHLPEGTTVTTQSYTLHRDSESFPNAEK